MSAQAETLSGDPRAYAQWVIIKLMNSGNSDMKVTNMDVSWGKLHADGDKDKEISTSTYNNYVIHSGDSLQLNACGRESSPSGTTGEFDLVDPADGDKVIRHFYWDCPWGSPNNTWTVSKSNSKWMCESSGANLVNGALGTITVECMKKP